MRMRIITVIALLGLMAIAVLSFAQAAPPPNAPGNILDAITKLQQNVTELQHDVKSLYYIVTRVKTEINPPVRIFDFVTNPIDGSGHYRSTNLSNGIVTCSCQGNFGGVRIVGVLPYTDVVGYRMYSEGDASASITMPVPKQADYWDVDWSGCQYVDLWFFPIDTFNI